MEASMQVKENLNLFLRIVLFILCLSPILLTASAVDQNGRYSKADAPAWVKPYDFPLEAVPVKPSQVNLQYLLIDTQRNWEEKTLYRHFAVKALTQSGIETISQINIDFDPSYCQVIMHAIRIYRGGEWFDRLENSRHNVIQREKELEYNLYNGDLTLVYFLDDIREGDIIEYSYSLMGQHPFFASHYTGMVHLQREFSVEKITHRLLGNPDLSFQIKPVNTTIEPRILDLTSSLREWSWEATETLPHSYEPSQPIWHNPPDHIEISQYKSWGEVAQKLYPLYTLPPDFAQSIPSEMRALVEKWKGSAKDLQKRALLALRFVQDEVRYLGIEEGMGAFQPSDPSLIFQRRFGDCKDKSFLLHALLQLMDIPSKPLLVHSSRGKLLPDILPIPALFNHLVLQLEVDGITYFVDPTFSLQGGSLETNFFPDYGWGLLLSKDTETLTPLPKTVFRKPTEIGTSYILESEDSALLKIKSIFHDSRADRLRRSFEWDGLEKISEESLSRMQEVYGAATLDSPMEALDDRENNIFALIESYRLPTQQLSDRKAIEVFSFTLRSYLHSRVNPERSSPYAIVYPLWVKEHIHVQNPFMNWKPFEQIYKKEHESLFYTLSAHVERHSADYDFELKHLQDHVSKSTLRDYWNIVNDIEKKAPPDMPIYSRASTGRTSFLSLYCSIAGLLIWPLLYFLTRKKRPTQDWLSFHLSKFQKFFCASTLVSTVYAYIYESSAHAGITAGGIVLVTGTLCNLIVIKRSEKIVLILQGTLALQACFLSFLIFIMEDVGLGKSIFSFLVCCLYIGYGWINLNKAKAFLVEEKKAANMVS